MKETDINSDNDIFSICHLDHLSEAHRTTLLRYLRPIELAAGVGLIGANAKDGQIYFLTEGRIKIILLAEEHAPLVFGTMGPGTIISNLWKQQRSERIHVETIEPTTLWTFEGAQFEHILRTDPDLAILLLKRFERDSQARWHHTLKRLHQFC